MQQDTSETATTGKTTDGQDPDLSNGYVADRKYIRSNPVKAESLFTHYPEAVREDALWLWMFTKTRCNSEHALLGKIARSIGIKDRTGKDPSDQYWYQVVTGQYFKSGGSAQQFKLYVAAFRAHARSMDKSGMIPFIETKNWKLISNYIEARRSFNVSRRIGAIEGVTGSQKTFCEKQYASIHNHLETVHVESPARSTLPRMIQKLAAHYEFPMSATAGEKAVMLEQWLKGASMAQNGLERDTARPRCLILGNVQRLFRPNVQPDQQPIFNYLMEIQDDLGFTLILEWVPTFTKKVTGGDPFWNQLLARIGGEESILRLQPELPKADILKFAKAFKVANDAAAFPILKKWGTTKLGIRRLVYPLEDARQIANERGLDEIPASILQEVDLEPVTLSAEEQEEGGES
jgi:DNA transposition AAA+ family ATPase